VAGSAFVALALLGVFLPVLPTTPFLLLAAACYARSSERFYRWLRGNRLFGSYLDGYLSGRGIPLKIKAFTIAFLWVSILLTSIYALDSTVWRAVLLVVAAGVTVHLLFVRTEKTGVVDAGKDLD